MERLLWISLAGALGTAARYLVNVWATQRWGSSFPYATLIVNVVGCFAIALVMHVAATRASFSPTLRLALTTGLMGGLTTYSSFSYETVRLAQEGARRAAAINFAVTTVACFAAVLLGLTTARAIVGR